MQSSIACQTASIPAFTSGPGITAVSLAHFISAMVLPVALPHRSISCAEPKGCG
jgi:hypothetical protein